MVYLLRYIRDNQTLGLNYYADKKDALLSDLSRQDNIKTENQLMAFYDSIWKYCPNTGISTRAYVIIYQVGPIDHGIHFPGTVAQ